jgi:hypothetical protein
MIMRLRFVYVVALGLSLAAGLAACANGAARPVSAAGGADLEGVFARGAAHFDGIQYRVTSLAHARDLVAQKEELTAVAAHAQAARDLILRVPKLTILRGNEYARAKRMADEAAKACEAVKARADEFETADLKDEVLNAAALFDALRSYVQRAEAGAARN